MINKDKTEDMKNDQLFLKVFKLPRMWRRYAYTIIHNSPPSRFVDSAHPGFRSFLSDVQTEQAYVDGEISH